jgi:periplasmic protein CpxP/Spy
MSPTDNNDSRDSTGRPAGGAASGDDHSATASGTGGDGAGPRPRGLRRRWKIAGVAAAVVGVLTIGACTHAGTAGPRGWGGWGHGGHGMTSGPVDPERAAQFAEKMADRLVSRVDGTPEQKQRLTVIAQAATKDLLPLRDEMRNARTRSIELLKAPNVDRAAIETLRADQMRIADRASQRLAQAAADAAEVLTPEQRAQLAERMTARRGWRS